MEQIYKPCSVLDNHLSRLIVTNKFKRTTILDQSRANFVFHPFVLAPDGVYIAYMSPYSWWALTSPFQPYRENSAVYFCCTSLKITPTWRYQASLLCGARTFLVLCRDCLIYSVLYFTLYYIFVKYILNKCSKRITFRISKYFSICHFANYIL